MLWGEGGHKAGSSLCPWLHGWPRPAPEDGTSPGVGTLLLTEKIEQGRNQNHSHGQGQPGKDKRSLLLLRKCTERIWVFSCVGCMETYLQEIEHLS